MSQRVLITGATGFIGSNLAKKLVTSGEEVHVLTRENSNTWRINSILKRVRNHRVDLSQERELRGILQEIQPDYIFHLANAGVYGGVSVSDKELVNINLLGLVNLISALEEVDYKGFINMGSSSEYGLKDRPMKETDLCEPVNTYGVSKLAATCYASFTAKLKNKPIITFRLFSPFGPYDDYRRLISKVILDLLANRELILTNPGAVRDYIFINDVVELLWQAKDRAGTLKGEIFNVGTGKEHKISEVVELIARFNNSNIKINWEAAISRPWEPPKWEADIKKTLSAFNWQPKHSLEEGIGKTIDWFRENRDLYNQFFDKL